VEKPEGKKSIGRHRCRWQDNIQMNFEDIGLEAWTG
jgi:hypothetical protein